MSTVLVINCGSSSLKYQLIDPKQSTPVLTGVVEGIGDEDSLLGALHATFDAHGPVLAESGLVAFGHRIVHGGDRFHEPTVLDDDVLAELAELSVLAPLHNPPAIRGVRAAMKLRPDLPQVGVFDTGFFANLPEAAYTYAIDRDIAAQHHIRRYGFHGTSHAFVSAAAADFLGRPTTTLNQIVLHLGNGASISAIANGRAVDTSMGMTPLEGLVMGTRSGDIDAGIVGYLASSAGMSAHEIDVLLNKRSGLLGLAGVNDFRALQELREAGEAAAELAYQVYVRRIVKYVGAYLAVLGHADVLTFTAGIGENNPGLRQDIAQALKSLGFVLDSERNAARGGGARRISADESPTTLLVVPTNEELAIAQATATLLAEGPGSVPA